MKKILITGANSYIGMSFESYMKQFDDEYIIDTVDMIDGSWRKKSFKGYDVVFHVAGIAHVKETKENAHLYYEVNKDLAIETAKKSKEDGLKQFILLSSMSVYGKDVGVITKDTIPNAKTHYGKSKLMADMEIQKMADDRFRVVMLRPPMIYGKGCKGNYQELVRIATKLPVFPNINNKRSMLYIDNLCHFVKLMIDNEESGLYCPQNATYTGTSDMVKRIAAAREGKITLLPGLGWAIKILMKLPGKIGRLSTKAFGTLMYEMELSEYRENYNIVNFPESIIRTERTNNS